MKSFLYRIYGIPGLEDPVDRKLICSSTSISESDGYMELISPDEESERYVNLTPKSIVALRYGLTPAYKYYNAYSYEIETGVDEVEVDGEVKSLNRVKLNVRVIDSIK